MNGEIIEYYKRDARTYETRRFRRGGRLVHEVEMNILLKLLNLCSQDFILDVGVGTGRFESVVEKFGCSIVSCDLVREMLDIAKENTNAFLVLADVFRLPFKDDTFDKCVALRFLFHFSDKNKVQILEEIVRVTKKKGLIVFDLHSSGGLLNFMASLRRDRLNFPVSPKKLEQMLQKIPEIRYKLYFSFFVPRGIYRHIPKALAWVLLSLDRILPDVIKHRKCSTLFCRGIRS